MPKCALLALDISGFRVKLLDKHRMAGSPYDPSRAPVAYGRRAVPQLFSELQQQEAPRRLRALASLADGRLLIILQEKRAEALLTLVPKLMLKLREEEEEEDVQVLLLSTLSSCSCLDPLPALASDGVSLLLHKLSDSSTDIRREATAALMALSVCEDGMRQVCEEEVLPVLVDLLRDKDVEVQANAAGVIMYAAIINEGKRQCLDLDVIPILLSLVSQDGEEEKDKERKKALVMYSLRALTALAEAPQGRCLLLEQLPLLGRRSEAAEEDQDIRRNAQNAVRVITWTPCNTGDP
ncbi:hypothetical protein F7725_013334 [Dissostichus mawsoni]|uniref:Radial spoke head 14 homolog n=1 Tax=Dissostichus mawsoni TaxID=36200 RepID=A0A7J5YPR9_DISMA|nr:hypothetical protein F7725_013334 [Dissostichus mawsoni]